MANPKKIVLIVFKNTSTFDYAIPVLWKLRKEHPSLEITVLYCVFDRRQIVRDARYYEKVFSQNGIKEKDLGSFLKWPLSLLEALLRRVIRDPLSDLKSEVSDRGVFNSGGRGPLKHLKGLFVRVVNRLIEPTVDFQKAMRELQPDLIFLDHRLTQSFYCKKQLWGYLKAAKKSLVLVPHAPHFIDEDGDYYPFMAEGNSIPAYGEYWMPFKYCRPFIRNPENRSAYRYVGYPGFDREWLSTLGERKRKGDETLTCLILTRKFLPEGADRPEGYDPFTQDYAVVLEMLDLIGTAISQSERSVKILVKPHPGSNFPELNKMLRRSKLPSFEVTGEPYYSLLSEIDLCVSQFSTSLLLPLFSGIPTLVLNCSLQRHVHDSWEVLAKMYLGLRYFVEAPEKELGEIFEVAAKEALEMRITSSYENEDQRFLKEFYSEGQLASAEGRVREILKL